MKKTLLGLAVAASLFSATAMAKNVNRNGSSDQYILAKETTVAGTGFDAFKGQMEANIGFNMGAGTTAYARITCAAGPTEFRFPNDVTVTYTDNADAAIAAGYTTSAVNVASGGNALVVSIVRDAGGTAGLSTDRINLDTVTGFSLAKNVDKFDCKYVLYDNAADAVAGNTTGVLFTGTPETFVIRDTAYALTVLQERTLIAEVTPPPGGVAYSQFVPQVGPPVVTLNGPNELANGIKGDVRANTVDLNGAAVTLPALATAQQFKLTTVENVSLDGLTFYLETAATCDGMAAPDLAGTMNAAMTEVTFATQNPAANTQYRLCVSSEGTEAKAIPKAQFQISVNPTPAAGSAITGKGPVNSGKIIYNGVTLIASIMQSTGANDFLGRVYITNKGNTARNYTVEIYNDSGAVVNTYSGTLAAKAMTSIAAETLFPAGQRPRGSVYFNINAPDADIEGMYQIVNQTKGSISNSQLVRPGKN